MSIVRKFGRCFAYRRENIAETFLRLLCIQYNIVAKRRPQKRNHMYLILYRPDRRVSKSKYAFIPGFFMKIRHIIL